MEKIEALTVDGYVFANHEDAEIAKNEIRKIEYIESHVDMTNIAVVKSVYEKALNERYFQTPIGLEYLRDLQKIMTSGGVKEEQIKPIPLYTTFKRIDLKNSDSVKRRVTKAEKKEMSLRMKYRNAVLTAVILGVLYIAMLMITLHGSTPNALNYKNAVTNQYAEWEQQLREREAAVREKERSLNINE